MVPSSTGGSTDVSDQQASLLQVIISIRMYLTDVFAYVVLATAMILDSHRPGM